MRNRNQRQSVKEKMMTHSIDFIKQIIPVVAGILIALFIDNWKDAQKDKKYIEQVFSTIDSELKETNQEINAIIPQQESLIDSLDSYVNNKNFNILEVVRKSNGIQIPKIKLNAWKSVSNSKIDLLNYKKIASLSDIEEQKGILKDKTQFLMTFLYSNFYETEKNKKETLKMLMLDIIQTEKTTRDLISSTEK